LKRKRILKREVKLNGFEKFITKFGYIMALFIGLNIIIFPDSYMIDSMSNSLFVKLFGVITILVSYLIYFKMQILLQKKSFFEKIGLTLLVSGILVLSTNNLILRINSNIGIQQKIYIKGKVIERRAYIDDREYRSATTYSTTILTDSNEEIELDISEVKYKVIKVGDMYSEVWKKGFLGILYRNKTSCS